MLMLNNEGLNQHGRLSVHCTSCCKQTETRWTLIAMTTPRERLSLCRESKTDGRSLVLSRDRLQRDVKVRRAATGD